MHELAIAEEVLKTALDGAPGERLLRIVLEVGVLVGLEPAAIDFCFESVARGTLAEGASLEIRDVLAEARCRSCGRVSEQARPWDPCPGCGGHDLEVARGRELRVMELEVA